ncbi:MAG: serine/threonine-protein phosphatase [Deltaproteobacteria bacterium]|nr:serine/threonine-protein phosphatase [Deltaproteobacteria bacterium]
MNLSFTEKTAIGNKRKSNEDYYGNCYNKIIDAHLFCLADGMGGYEAGEHASRIAVESVIKDFSLLTQKDLDPEILVACFFENAQNRLRYYKVNNNISRFGTTLAVLIFFDHSTVCANLGDTRIYSFSENLLTQESYDHTEIEELIRCGIITRQEAAQHSRQHVLTGALTGENQTVTPHIKKLIDKPDCTFLIASDGLYRMVKDNIILQILTHSNIEEAGAELLQEALKSGGEDNITLQIITNKK